MAISKAQQRAVAKYDAKNYDKICVRIKKGQRDILKAHAEEQGESLNGWIVSAIKAKLKQEQARTPKQSREHNLNRTLYNLHKYNQKHGTRLSNGQYKAKIETGEITI